MSRLLIGLLGLVLSLSACSGLQGTGDANFITGEGSIVQWAPEDRGDPVASSGETLQGDPIDLADFRGQIVVLNFWGAWCNPCREEAPVLAEASEQLDAVFVGAQARSEPAANAIAFEEEFHITYPTIADSGETMLRMGRFGPKQPPSTAVLDRQGRVAALVSGTVPSVRTLEDLIEDVDGSGSDG